MADRQYSPRRQVDDGCKVFITNIEGNQSEEVVEEELRKLFTPIGRIVKLNVKKNKNGHYYFAFLEYQHPDDSAKAIQELDQFQIFGKRMRVRQDKQSEGCFYCKKPGHFARQCPENKNRDGDHKMPRDSNDDYQQSYRRTYERSSYREQRYPREERGGDHYRRQQYRERPRRDDVDRRREDRGRRYEDDRHGDRYNDGSRRSRGEDRYRGDYGDRYAHEHRQDYGRERKYYRERRRSRSYSGERHRRRSPSYSGSYDRHYREPRPHHRDSGNDWRRDERRGGNNYRARRSPEQRSPSSSSYSSSH